MIIDAEKNRARRARCKVSLNPWNKVGKTIEET